MERAQFTFYRSYYEAIQNLPKREQTAVLLAVCAYALDNQEPKLSGTANAIFTLIRPTLDTSRRKALSGKKGGENGSKPEASGKQTASKPEASGKQTAREKEREEEKEVEIENECCITPPQKKTRHKYGRYANVLLTDEELDKLKAEFPADWEQRIERLSEYIESKGAKYKNHLATIRSWARNEGTKTKQYSRTEPTPSWMQSKGMPGSAGAPPAGSVDKYMQWDDPAPEVQQEAEEMQRRMQAKYGRQSKG